MYGNGAEIQNGFKAHVLSQCFKMLKSTSRTNAPRYFKVNICALQHEKKTLINAEINVST